MAPSPGWRRRALAKPSTSSAANPPPTERAGWLPPRGSDGVGLWEPPPVFGGRGERGAATSGRVRRWREGAGNSVWGWRYGRRSRWGTTPHPHCPATPWLWVARVARRCRRQGSTTGSGRCDSWGAERVAGARPTGFHVARWRVSLGPRQAAGVAGAVGRRAGDARCLGRVLSLHFFFFFCRARQVSVQFVLLLSLLCLALMAQHVWGELPLCSCRCFLSCCAAALRCCPSAWRVQSTTTVASAAAVLPAPPDGSTDAARRPPRQPCCARQPTGRTVV